MHQFFVHKKYTKPPMWFSKKKKKNTQPLLDAAPTHDVEGKKCENLDMALVSAMHLPV